MLIWIFTNLHCKRLPQIPAAVRRNPRRAAAALRANRRSRPALLSTRSAQKHQSAPLSSHLGNPQDNKLTPHWAPTGFKDLSVQKRWAANQQSAWLTQQASECYGWREGSEVDKDDGGHALAVQGVLEVTEVLWVTTLHISYQPTERAPGAPQRVVRLFQRCEEGLCATKRMGYILQLNSIRSFIW